MPLNLDITYRAILAAARENRFISYGDLAKANDEAWQKVRRQMPSHLGQLMQLCHDEGWPLLSAVVVPQGEVESGHPEGRAKDAFINAARDLGCEIDVPDAFVAEQ